MDAFFLYIYICLNREKNCHCTVKSFVDCPEDWCVCVCVWVCVKSLVTSFPSKLYKVGWVYRLKGQSGRYSHRNESDARSLLITVQTVEKLWRITWLNETQRNLTGSRVDESISSIKFLSPVDLLFFFLTVWVSECVNIIYIYIYIYICIYEYCKCCFYMFSEWMTSHGEQGRTTWPPDAFVKRDLASGFS